MFNIFLTFFLFLGSIFFYQVNTNFNHFYQVVKSYTKSYIATCVYYNEEAGSLYFLPSKVMATTNNYFSTNLKFARQNYVITYTFINDIDGSVGLIHPSKVEIEIVAKIFTDIKNYQKVSFRITNNE